MMSNIELTLQKRFEKHRIVFWYDDKNEFIEAYNAINIDGVEKIPVDKNEFEVKYIVVKQFPEKKFLLYFNSSKPENIENWLLDLELAHNIFSTNKSSIYIQELGIDYHYTDLIEETIEFYGSQSRMSKLKSIITSNDGHKEIRNKILSVVFNVDNIDIQYFILSHISKSVNGKDAFEKELKKYNLHKYYWEEIEHKYNYINENPSIYDFVLFAFKNAFSLTNKSNVSPNIHLLLSLWQNVLPYRNSFGELSNKVAKHLNIEQLLSKSEISDIIDDNLFNLCEQKIIHELNTLLISENISKDKILNIKKSRENKFWYKDYDYFYQNIKYASQLFEKVKEWANINYQTIDEGIKDYADNKFSVDYYYRKYVFTYRKTNQDSLLSKLSEKVEKVYSNDWLLSYNNKWQKLIDNTTSWTSLNNKLQANFYKNNVKKHFDNEKRIFVIISDALRYENGRELGSKLRSENRYEAEDDYMLSVLPSYTQLGMAALLPHKKLSFKENSDTIIVDGIPSIGIVGRTKILQSNLGERAIAIRAEDLLKMKSNTDGRAFVKNYDLIYIYHNWIDKTGDDKTSEERVFEAVEEELDYIMKLIKKIANMNGNNIFVTSDHGYLYQNSKIDESDFSLTEHSGNIWKENRRFVIGTDLKNTKSTKHFTSEQLGIDSNAEVLIPKSINRLRIKGAGSRFVHGGASMQEVVIPLIKISKKRSNTTSQVDVDIIKSTDKITTNMISISFLQKNIATDHTLPRTIKAAIYAEDGERLSDVFDYTFDAKRGTERQREVKHSFQLNHKASDTYKKQRVKLILKQPIKNSSQWEVYNEFYYTLNISFTNDFDF